MRLPELTVKRKIIATFAFLSATIIGLSYWAASNQLEKADLSRGRFLAKHYDRFDAYRTGLGDAIAAAATFVASDDAVRSVLRGQVVDPATSGHVLARIQDALQKSIEADFLVVLNQRGESVLSTDDAPFSARDIEEGRYFTDLRSGVTVRSAILVTSRGVYQVSGVPVRAESGEVLGSLTVGVALGRYFDEFRQQSDRDPSKQYRLSFVRADKVLASVFAHGEWDQLGAALDDDSWRKVPDGVNEEGEPQTADVIEYKNGTFDFYDAEVQGYAANEAGKVGRIFLLRTRDFKEDQRLDKFKEMLVPFSVILLGAIVVGWLFSLLITRPLDRFVRATESLAKGEADLTQRIEVTSRDEMGRLATNLNALFASLQTLAKGVQRTSFQVASSSAEISAASRQMYDGAKDQAGKVQGSSAAVTELSSSIQHVAENAVEATRVAKQSGEAVQRAIERMQRIRSTVEQAAERILDLGESGKRIGNIVEVIRQISEQTSLLALNASIEAAHAGEQGRGFAVVADEVSSLARRVGQSARDIEDLIATIKDQTAEAVRTMQAGTHEVEEGTTLVATTLADLKKIAEVVAYTAQAVQEQAVASDEIARNMDAVQRIAQEVVTSSEEAVVQGEHLHQIATTLAESVKGFKVDRDGDGIADEPPILPPTSRSDKRLPARRTS